MPVLPVLFHGQNMFTIGLRYSVDILDIEQTATAARRAMSMIPVLLLLYLFPAYSIMMSLTRKRKRFDGCARLVSSRLASDSKDGLPRGECTELSGPWVGVGVGVGSDSYRSGREGGRRSSQSPE